MGPKRRDDEVQSAMTRLAVVNPDRCKPKKCRQECKKACPLVKQGKLCIEVTAQDKICTISEELCIGCGLCVKRCPFDAVMIINLPSNLEKETIHRYGPNSFKLHRLPLPRPGQVLGLVGANGTGKSTALKILQGKIKPNLGNFKNEPSWEDILKYFRGSEHQAYFKKVLEDNIKALMKPQYVDQVGKASKGDVLTLLQKRDERNTLEFYVKELDLGNILGNQVAKLSGGEMQRLTIAAVCMQEGQMMMFDEPSSFLDVKQRMKAAEIIRGIVKQDSYVIVVEHDLAVVDYMSDLVCVLYGRPGAYGVVTMPYGVREGINIFLEGFVPTENLRFREEGLQFRMGEVDETCKKSSRYKYPFLKKTQGQFTLNVEEGEFTDSEIIVLLGENGCGKTTFIRLLAGVDKPDDGTEIPRLNVSYKPQMINPKFAGTVKDLLQTKINDAYLHPQFQTDVFKPLCIEDLLDQEVQNLSGGELQRVAIALALGKPADLYLLDEPSAYLDSDQRIMAAKVIKRFVLHSKKTAFIVEHDFIMATYMADRVVVYDGEPGINCTARPPEQLMGGMNNFLKSMEITFRRDPDNFRPRINKKGSVKDREQKNAGHYFYMQEVEDPKKVKDKDKKKGKKGKGKKDESSSEEDAGSSGEESN